MAFYNPMLFSKFLSRFLMKLKVHYVNYLHFINMFIMLSTITALRGHFIKPQTKSVHPYLKYYYEYFKTAFCNLFPPLLNYKYECTISIKRSLIYLALCQIASKLSLYLLFQFFLPCVNFSISIINTLKVQCSFLTPVVLNGSCSVSPTLSGMYHFQLYPLIVSKH